MTTEVEVLRGTQRIKLNVTPEVNPALTPPDGDPRPPGDAVDE